MVPLLIMATSLVSKINTRVALVKGWVNSFLAFMGQLYIGFYISSLYSRTARSVCITIFPVSAFLPDCAGATHAANRAYAARSDRTPTTKVATLPRSSREENWQDDEGKHVTQQQGGNDHGTA